jgi:hypothetical protein
MASGTRTYSAWQPSIVLPKRQPPVGLKPFPVAGDRGAELLDHADRLVADHQPFAHRVLAAQDMDVGAADRGRRDPDQCVERADIGDRPRLQRDPPRLDEHGRLHLRHGLPPWTGYPSG